ncbi:hypothetical protein pb186bvf_004918 [Paramecium bursaria]
MRNFYQSQGFQQVSCQIAGHDDQNAEERMSAIKTALFQMSSQCTQQSQNNTYSQGVKVFLRSQKVNQFKWYFEKNREDIVRLLNFLYNQIKGVGKGPGKPNRILKFVGKQFSKQQNNFIFRTKKLNSDGEQIQIKDLQPSDLFPILDERIKKYQQEIANLWKYNLGFVDAETPTQRDSYRGQNQQPEQYLQDYQEPYQKPKEKIKIPLQLQLDSFQIFRIVLLQLNKMYFSQMQTVDNNANDVACLNMPLSPYEKKSFVFQINKGTGYLGIGIAILKVIKPQKFFFGQLNQTGHGVFMVLNNRVVYNNSYLEHNRISIKMELKEGKKYQLTFDPLNRNRKQFNLQPLNDYQADPYSMPIDIDETIDYHMEKLNSQMNSEYQIQNYVWLLIITFQIIQGERVALEEHYSMNC